MLPTTETIKLRFACSSCRKKLRAAVPKKAILKGSKVYVRCPSCADRLVVKPTPRDVKLAKETLTGSVGETSQLASLQESATPILQALPPSEQNIAPPPEEVEEWIAIKGGCFERRPSNAAAGCFSPRPIAKKRRARKAVLCNNTPRGLKGTAHDGPCTYMVVFGKRGGPRPGAAPSKCCYVRPHVARRHRAQAGPSHQPPAKEAIEETEAVKDGNVAEDAPHIAIRSACKMVVEQLHTHVGQLHM